MNNHKNQTKIELIALKFNDGRKLCYHLKGKYLIGLLQVNQVRTRVRTEAFNLTVNKVSLKKIDDLLFENVRQIKASNMELRKLEYCVSLTITSKERVKYHT